MASIETSNLHKAEPRGLSEDEDVCVRCGQYIKHLPAGQGWVHEDGHVLGYNEAPLQTFTFVIAASIAATDRQDAWDKWVEWLHEPNNIEGATTVTPDLPDDGALALRNTLDEKGNPYR